MGFLLELWIPILVSAVLVFVVSSVIHIFMTYHRSDFRKLPDEDSIMESLRKFNIPPGDYVMPCAGSAKGMKSPEFLEKTTKGPVAFMTVIKSGPPQMGTSLVMWFAYSLLISVFSAYICNRAVGPGAYYLEVFRFVGCSAFMGYGFALLQNSIWYKRNWGATLKSMFDGLVYALVTAGTFGWLWPSA